MDLLAREPWLLKEFERGFNTHVRESRTNYSQDVDRRSTPQKVLALANAERSGPRELVEASLDGLSEVRRQLPR